MTVRRLLAETDALELTQWQAYELVYGPLGGLRGDVQAGVVASVIANANRGENTEPYSPNDFLPPWGQDDDDEDEEVDDG